MEIKVLEKKDDQLKLEIAGGDYTLFNLLKLELLNDPKVKFAGFRKEHPLIDKSIFVVKTVDKKTKPLKVIEKVVAGIKTKLKDFKRNIR